MKAYLLSVLIVDHDNNQEDGIRFVLENTHYSNNCINPIVISVKEAEIGEWEDDNLLNNGTKDREAEVKRLFGNHNT